MTTKKRQSATEKPHWTDETAGAAVQAVIKARVLMLATARVLGLPDEDVEQAPQRAAELMVDLIAFRMQSLCSECAVIPSRRLHSGTHCRWCGRPLVVPEGEERLSYADLRTRLIEIERHDV